MGFAKLFLLCVPFVMGATNNTRPNILFILADDLGFGDLGFTGSAIRTPNIDALASAGQVLGHYYVMHCCSPTRSALMTGRYNIRYGLQTGVIPNNKAYGLDLREQLLPEYLQKLGYTTHAVGKWHLGLYRWEYTPTFRGFESFFGYYSGSQDYYTHKDSGYDLHLDKNEKCGMNCSQSLARQYAGNYSSTLFSMRAETIIKEHDKSRPLFLYMPYQSVHCPIQVPQAYVAPYMHLDPNRRIFAGMLSALDESIGRVISALQARDMWENTLTVFSTDNGGPVGSMDERPQGIGCATGAQNYPLRGGKGAYFQGGVRGTGFVHGAGLSPALAGSTNRHLFHVTDWVPTLVHAAAAGQYDVAHGLLIQNALEGRPLDGVSQWKLLSGGSSAGSIASTDGDLMKPSANMHAEADEADAREDLLLNIERDHPTTAPCVGAGCHGCNGVGQYAVIKGRHKLLVGGGGLPNDWYHDGLPYNGSTPTPQGGCLVACSEPALNASSGCLPSPYIQLFDLFADPSERNNLAASQPELVQELMAVVQHYNTTGVYVPALMVTTPVENRCPTYPNGVLTPCAGEPGL